MASSYKKRSILLEDEIMSDEDVDDTDWDDNDEEYESVVEPRQVTRASTLASRRRLEDLQELKRMRELLGDDDFVLDFS
tara:strand:+ start:234 stop:470 length:237 start_codon:yes stop_codon:yes gene_type:complete